MLRNLTKGRTYAFTNIGVKISMHIYLNIYSRESIFFLKGDSAIQFNPVFPEVYLEPTRAPTMKLF